MKTRILVSLSLIFAFALAVQAQPSPEYQRELREYIQDNYKKREVMIPMRDGVKLFTSIYYPEKDSEKYPILLQRTPYSVAPYGKGKDGKDQYKGALGPDFLFAREG